MKSHGFFSYYVTKFNCFCHLSPLVFNHLSCYNKINWVADDYPKATATKYCPAYMETTRLQNVYELPQTIKQAVDNGKSGLYLQFTNGDTLDYSMLSHISAHLENHYLYQLMDYCARAKIPFTTSTLGSIIPIPPPKRKATIGVRCKKPSNRHFIRKFYSVHNNTPDSYRLASVRRYLFYFNCSFAACTALSTSSMRRQLGSVLAATRATISSYSIHTTSETSSSCKTKVLGSKSL